jgi:S-formylglutathione hydrolase FrmB
MQMAFFQRFGWLVFCCLVAARLLAAEGFHEVESEYQHGANVIRVLIPDQLDLNQKYPVLYVLPVEEKTGTHWGDPVAEFRTLDFHNKHNLICVFPTFSDLPWYADHPTNHKLRQESYFLKIVVPLIERNYPARPEPAGRLLLGFSKSGWGAWSLLLRHPQVFGKAAAFDAPIMQAKPDKYGMGPIFGTLENFKHYFIPDALQRGAETLQGPSRRLILIGYDNFQAEHAQAHALLETLKIPHVYIEGPPRKHAWGSGWIPEAVENLVRSEPQ